MQRLTFSFMCRAMAILLVFYAAAGVYFVVSWGWTRGWLWLIAAVVAIPVAFFLWRVPKNQGPC